MSSFPSERLTWYGAVARTALVAAFLVVASGWAGSAETKSAAEVSFPTASVHFEQNATDGDFEVVFQVKGGKDGLADLTVVAPNGRTVVAFKAPSAATLGMRSFRFESPEPPDLKALAAAYPEGVYRFSGKTFAGAKLVGASTLNHRLPATATVVKPAPEAARVGLKGLTISWSAVEGITGYVVGLKQVELNTSITAQVPASSTTFAVPDGFLAPGKKYKVSIGTVSRERNISFVETTFTTEN